MNKVIGAIVTLAILLTITAGCALMSGGSTPNVANSQPRETATVPEIASAATAYPAKVNTSTGEADSAAEEPTADLPDYSGATEIVLGDTIIVNGSGASVSGSTVRITTGGSYSVSGTLDDGQIIVDSQDKELVTLILNGVDITCSTSAPIYAVDAKKMVIVLTEGTDNYVTDGDSYILEDAKANEPNAAVFSKCDLTISGSGLLQVIANYNDGIASKDDLEITGGTITVESVGDGIRGRDAIVITDGDITVTAAADGFKSTNDEDPGKGLVTIEGGVIKITAGQDGIDAQTSVLVRGGNITLATGGGSTNSSKGSGWGNWGATNDTQEKATAISAKGIKGVVSVTIEAGAINVDSSDDSIHSNGSVTINGGAITIASGDDGMHADSALAINGGQVDITQSYEGVESAVIAITEGTIHVVASDDGINVAGGDDGSAVNGRPGQNTFSTSGNNHLDISGGYIVVDATGDGLDINGAITMTDGVVIVSGPTRNDNGALDYDAGFSMTGGYLVAAGSAGMAQAPDTSSTQYAVMVNLASALSAGTLVHIETQQGAEILTFEPSKQYQSVVLCSPALAKGTSYNAYTGGSSTGTVTDGLYSGGTYTAGTLAMNFTISGIVTGVGSVRGGMPGGGRR
jgi:hypothetical protein